MAISATYITLQRQIADELGNRTDLLSPLSSSSLTLSPIKNAIQSAIAKWEREPFYFNELYDTAFFTTVANQEVYTSADAAAIATVASITRLRVTANGTRYPLTPRNWGYIDDVSATTVSTGQPIDFAYFAESIRLYPIPDAAYAVALSGTKRFTALSADADTNVWTSDAYDLIRSEAKLILARETIHDDELAKRMHIAIYGDPVDPRSRGYLSVLKAETTRRARARIIPTQF